ncbi:MAG: OsmC family protein [Methylophilaceae bacterium]
MTTSTSHANKFISIDRDALKVLSEKGKSDPNTVKSVSCVTIAEGKKFRHLNYIRDLEAYIVDEPRGALGDDTAPNPLEALLAALGSCLAVGIQANIVTKGGIVNAIKLELEGDTITSGVWGTGNLSPKTVGFSSVRIKAHVEADGLNEVELSEIINHAAKWSPVLNTIQNSIPVAINRN